MGHQCRQIPTNIITYVVSKYKTYMNSRIDNVLIKPKKKIQKSNPKKNKENKSIRINNFLDKQPPTNKKILVM